MAAGKTNKQLSVTLVKSPIGALPRHRDCVRGLGLRRLHHTVTLVDTPAVRGMINHVNHLVTVEEG